MDLSAYVLARVNSPLAAQFALCLRGNRELGGARLALAALHALLTRLGAGELGEAVQIAPPNRMSPELENYVAAMVEQACVKAGIPPPAWTRAIPPLIRPLFASSLRSLQLYLLTHSPPAFRRRNLFVDATLGAQV